MKMKNKKQNKKNNTLRKRIKRTARKGVAARGGDRMTFSLNPEFEFFNELRSLILKSSPAEKDKMIKRIMGLGRVKMAVISGVFLSNKETVDIYDSNIDLFIVGDDINRKKLNSLLKSLEAEVGKEIKFGIMEKDEFEYRYGMFDRFVRVLLEKPHEKLINKLNLT